MRKMNYSIILALASALMSVCYASFDPKDCIIDAAFVIDNSGSITNFGENMQNWEFVVKFAQDIARGINIGPGKSQVGLVDFHSYATTHFTLDAYSDEQETINAIGELPYQGYSTNTPEGLEYGRDLLTDPDQGSRPGVPKVMFVITDGEPALKYAAGLDDQIQKTKEAGIRIIAIGVTNEVKLETLQQLASTENDYYVVENFDKLDDIKRSVLNEDTCKAPPPVPVEVDEPMLIAACSAI